MLPAGPRATEASLRNPQAMSPQAALLSPCVLAAGITGYTKETVAADIQIPKGPGQGSGQRHGPRGSSERPRARTHKMG